MEKSYLYHSAHLRYLTYGSNEAYRDYSPQLEVEK